MGREEIVVVRWLQRSGYPTRDGSSRRNPGDEDPIKRQEARALEKSGLVEIIGPLDVVPQAMMVIDEEGEEDDASEASSSYLSSNTS